MTVRNPAIAQDPPAPPVRLTEPEIDLVAGGVPANVHIIEHYDANGQLISIVFKDSKGNIVFP